MKARRTPWWWYVIAMLVGLLAGMGISHLEETRGLGLAGIPYLASAVMVVVGFIVLYLAWQVHKYTTTDPKKRAQLKPMDSERCVNTLIVSKALAIAGALLAGWYGGQIVMLYDRFEAPVLQTYRHRMHYCGDCERHRHGARHHQRRTMPAAAEHGTGASEGRAQTP